MVVVAPTLTKWSMWIAFIVTTVRGTRGEKMELHLSVLNVDALQRYKMQCSGRSTNCGVPSYTSVTTAAS
jgi:hypothetical protein